MTKPRRGGEAEVTLADLQAEYRLLYDLDDDVPVSTRQLRELVDMVGHVKQGQPMLRPVTRDQVANAVGAGQPPGAVPPADEARPL